MEDLEEEEEVEEAEYMEEAITITILTMIIKIITAYKGKKEAEILHKTLDNNFCPKTTVFENPNY